MCLCSGIRRIVGRRRVQGTGRSEMRQMKRMQRYAGLVVAVLAVGGALQAQSGDTNQTSLTDSSDRKGQVVMPLEPATTDAGAGAGPISGTVTRLQDIPQQVQERLQQFELMREAYLKQQNELLRQLKGANDEQRELIREKLRDQRQRWLDQSRLFREQARERLAELKEKLLRHQDVLDAARERAREQLNGAEERVRERRGTD